MKSGGIGCFIAVMLLLASITLIPELSAYENPSNTIYVDDDNIDGPWDGTIEYPFQRIQDAIDSASNGDSVFVYSGMYYEQLKVDKSIILQGEDKNTTVIDSDTLFDVVYISANNTIITGFTITNTKYGHISEGETGIHIRSSNNLIMDNILIDNKVGIYIQVLDSNNTIEQNIFKDNGLGMKLRFTSYTVVENNTFIDNYWGMRLEYVVRIDISDNRIIGQFVEGLRLEGAYSCNISMNHLVLDGVSVQGMILDSSCSNSIHGNYFENMKNAGRGIFFTWTSNGNIVEKNDIKNFYGGICLFAGSSENVIKGNIIRENSKGINFESAECNDNTISENTIINNTQYGIYFTYEEYGNSFYHNNFLNNQNHANNKGDNSWDNGWKGNYWDDYESRYPDARKTLRGTWNMPYDVDDNNVDRYPLIKMYSHAKVTLMNRLWQLFPDGHILKNLVFQTYLQFQKIHDKNTYLPMKPMSVLITFSSY